MGSKELVSKIPLWRYDFKRRSDDGRAFDFDDNLQKTILELNTLQSTRGAAEKLNTPQSTVKCHLEKLGNINNLGVCVPQNLNERNKKNIPIVKIVPF